MLIDTGAGSFFGPKLGGKLQASLKTAGYTPGEIDAIFLTHIHRDHSGVPFPGVGHLRAEDQGYAWVPIDYQWREP